ncbi:hypothetical protein R6Z07F_010061 [Ovis aries]
MPPAARSAGGRWSVSECSPAEPMSWDRMRYILWDNNCSVPPRIHMTPFTAAAAAAELPASSGKARAQANGEPPPAGPQTLLLLLLLLFRTHRPRLGLAAAPPQRPVCTAESCAQQRERRRGAGGARSAQAPAPARPGSATNRSEVRLKQSLEGRRGKKFASGLDLFAHRGKKRIQRRGVCAKPRSRNSDVF